MTRVCRGAWLAPSIAVVAFAFQASAADGQKEPLPQIAPSTVQLSLEKHASAWEEKIAELGRPRLLLDQAGLEKMRQRFLAAKDSPEVKALVQSASEISARSLPEYISPGSMPNARERLSLTPTASFGCARWATISSP